MLAELVAIAAEAGNAIRKVPFDRSVPVAKGDGSPVTLADTASDHVIRSRLEREFPGIPIVSEESQDDRFDWEMDPFFLVDPLDGTKEFIAGYPEYTVNITLIEKGRPLLGVVYLPASETTYFGDVSKGVAWRSENKSEPTAIRPSGVFAGRLAVSRSHSSPAEAEFARRHRFKTLVVAGSSLKGCLVAEGKVDCYVRFGPVMAWDIAAMDAVASAAGCELLALDAAESISYNPEHLKIPSGFILAPQAKKYLVNA